jgi:hypothetical protein
MFFRNDIQWSVGFNEVGWPDVYWIVLCFISCGWSDVFQKSYSMKWGDQMCIVSMKHVISEKRRTARTSSNILFNTHPINPTLLYIIFHDILDHPCFIEYDFWKMRTTCNSWNIVLFNIHLVTPLHWISFLKNVGPPTPYEAYYLIHIWSPHFIEYHFLQYTGLSTLPLSIISVIRWITPLIEYVFL